MSEPEFRFKDDVDSELVVQRHYDGEGVWFQIRGNGFVLVPMDKARELAEQLRQMTEAQQ